jgi:hypothetical protein
VPSWRPRCFRPFFLVHSKSSEWLLSSVPPPVLIRSSSTVPSVGTSSAGGVHRDVHHRCTRLRRAHARRGEAPSDCICADRDRSYALCWRAIRARVHRWVDEHCTFVWPRRRDVVREFTLGGTSVAFLFLLHTRLTRSCSTGWDQRWEVFSLLSSTRFSRPSTTSVSTLDRRMELQQTCCAPHGLEGEASKHHLHPCPRLHASTACLGWYQRAPPANTNRNYQRPTCASWAPPSWWY